MDAKNKTNKEHTSYSFTLSACKSSHAGHTVTPGAHGNAIPSLPPPPPRPPPLHLPAAACSAAAAATSYRFSTTTTTTTSATTTTPATTATYYYYYHHDDDYYYCCYCYYSQVRAPMCWRVLGDLGAFASGSRSKKWLRPVA